MLSVYVLHAVRIALGALFLFSGISKFFGAVDPGELEGGTGAFAEAMFATGYMWPQIAAVEVGVGLALLTGFYVPLAVVVMAPLVVNIFLFHLVLAPTEVPGLAIATALVFANLYLAYAYRGNYVGLFEPRAAPTSS